MHTTDSQHDHELLVLLRCVKDICNPKRKWGKMPVYQVRVRLHLVQCTQSYMQTLERQGKVGIKEHVRQHNNMEVIGKFPNTSYVLFPFVKSKCS